MSHPYDPNQPQQPQWGQNPPPPPNYAPQGPWSPTNPHDIPPHAQALVQPKKKMSIGKKIAIGVGAFFAIAIVASAGGEDDDDRDDSAPTVISPEVNDNVNETAESGGFFTDSDTASVQLGDSVDVDQGDATATVTVANFASAPDQMWATDGGTIMQVEVTFVCESGTFAVNPFYFEARSSAGKTLTTAIGGSLNATECAAGESVSGAVGFEVPAGDTIDKIILQGTLFDRLADWSV